jgi:hypothetical protein
MGRTRTGELAVRGIGLIPEFAFRRRGGRGARGAGGGFGEIHRALPIYGKKHC